MIQEVLVWLAQHPAVWILALGVVCSLLYRWLDQYPRMHAIFRVLAAALPGDIVGIRKAFLELLEAQLAMKAGVDPVAFAAARDRPPHVVTPPAAAESFPPVSATPAQFPPSWDDPEERIRKP